MAESRRFYIMPEATIPQRPISNHGSHHPPAQFFQGNRPMKGHLDQPISNHGSHHPPPQFFQGKHPMKGHLNQPFSNQGSHHPPPQFFQGAQPMEGNLDQPCLNHGSPHPPGEYFHGTLPKKGHKADQPRQLGKIVIYRLPNRTTKFEVIKLLQSWLTGITVKTCYIHTPAKCREDNTKTLMSFVELLNDNEAQALVNYFHNVKDMNYFRFRNQAGIQGDIIVAYCYRERQSKFDKKKNENNENYETCKKDIELEYEQIISSIKDIEEELRKKIPDLFVSELEMYQLQKEEEEINRSNELKSEQIKVAKLELKEVRDAKEKYDELSSDDDE